MKENAVQAAVRAEAARLGCYLWRNNTGVLPDARGVPVRFGLGNDSSKVNKEIKSSDLIGIDRHGRFVAIEIKAPGWTKPRNDRERAQERFLELVCCNGGIAAFVTDVAQLKEILR